ncbi:MAG: delta-6 desaturase [Cyanobacteriota bacterium]|jgi:linoleoyl-CoA desaturase
MLADRIQFTQKKGFRKVLNQRVDAYFKNEGLSQRDNPQMYLKTVTIVVWLFSAWAFVLFAPVIFPVRLLGCVVLAMAIAAFSFNVGHDANHNSYSSNPTVNRLLGITYDFIGLSSFLWRYRHNYLHHTYTNILGHDVEIHGDGVVRMSPEQQHFGFYRFQQFYIWILYLFIPFYWFLYDIYLVLSKGKYHDHKIPPFNPWELVTLLGIKVLWFGYVFGLPLALGFSLPQVLAGVAVTYMTYGIIICTIFMLAHVVESTEFLTPDPDTAAIDDEWAICQIRTTANFATQSPIWNWYCGGLNHQITHHLFPNICHIHYPQLEQIVKDVCAEFEVEYNVYPTLASAIASNYRWLETMGKPS